MLGDMLRIHQYEIFQWFKLAKREKCCTQEKGHLATTGLAVHDNSHKQLEKVLI